MAELTPLGFIVILVIAFAISAFVYDTYFNDSSSLNPDYCNVYARQVLNDTKTPLPYRVNINVARGSCTTPRWEMTCPNTPENQKVRDCWSARAEPKFRLPVEREI